MKNVRHIKNDRYIEKCPPFWTFQAMLKSVRDIKNGPPCWKLSAMYRCVRHVEKNFIFKIIIN